MKRLFALLALCLLSTLAAAQDISPRLTLVASATYTGTITTADIATHPNAPIPTWKGGIVITNVSSYTTGTFTVNIQGKDPASGTYYTILTGAGLAAAGAQVLKVYPGITAVANASTADLLPATWRLQVTTPNNPTATMKLSIGALLIP